jgi:hypothetical protein
MTVEVRILDHTGAKAKTTSGRVANKIQNVISWRLGLAAMTMQRRIRKKFNNYGAGSPSSPGRYPKRLRGHAVKSISVKKVRGKNIIRAGYKANNPRHSMRLRWLENDTTIKPTSGKSLAIPLSLAAKRFASNATGDASANVKNFKAPGGKELTVQVRGRKGALTVFLGAKNSDRKAKMTGQTHTMHFLLTKNKNNKVRKSRRGLSDAFNAESNTFVNQITAGMQTQLQNVNV